MLSLSGFFYFAEEKRMEKGAELTDKETFTRKLVHDWIELPKEEKIRRIEGWKRRRNE